MLTKGEWNQMSIDEKYELMELARIPASRVAFNYGGWNERLWEALQEELGKRVQGVAGQAARIKNNAGKR